MNEVKPPINEDDLHAYVDGQLDPDRRAAVERHLAENPEAAERVAAYQAQRDILRSAFGASAFGASAGETLPRQLSLDHIIAQRNRRLPGAWLAAASVVLAFGIGLAGGWLVHAPRVPDRSQQALALLEQEAVASHAVYAVDVRHPVEVPGTETQHLQQWLSNRLDRTVIAPDLLTFGYHLVGGRLLATERGAAAALLMYEDADQHRITVLLRPMAPTLHAPGAAIRQNGVNGRAWIGNGLGVAVLAAMPEGEIDNLATHIGADFGMPG
jgi:anti-sigma factor RsiW